jgi:hypothetical protein
MQEVFKGWEAEIMQKQPPQQPYSPPQPQFNQYAPPPPQPQFIAAHYANSQSPPPPRFSAYSPYGDSGSHQNAVELPDNSTLLAPPPIPPQPAPPVQNGFQRSASTEVSVTFMMSWVSVLTSYRRRSASYPNCFSISAAYTVANRVLKTVQEAACEVFGLAIFVRKSAIQQH